MLFCSVLFYERLFAVEQLYSTFIYKIHEFYSYRTITTDISRLLANDLGAESIINRNDHKVSFQYTNLAHIQLKKCRFIRLLAGKYSLAKEGKRNLKDLREEPMLAQTGAAPVALVACYF